VVGSSAGKRGFGVPAAGSADGRGGNGVKQEPGAGAEASCACEHGRRGPVCRCSTSRPRVMQSCVVLNEVGARLPREARRERCCGWRPGGNNTLAAGVVGSGALAAGSGGGRTGSVTSRGRGGVATTFSHAAAG
jgi:hypothetical protein